MSLKDDPVQAASDGDDRQRRPFAKWVAPESRARRWGWKALKIVVIAPIALWLGYALLVNIALSSKLLANLVSNYPEEVQMDYDSAYSLWPGKLHVEGFRMSGQDTVLQWSVLVDEADADIKLTELFRKKFHATKVRAKGYSQRIRTRVDPTSTPDLEDARIKALAPIMGHTNPPLKAALPPQKDLQLSDEDYDLWTAQLDDIDATINEVWVEQMRYAGEGRLRGGFYFKPLRAVRVGPAVLELRDGQIHFGDQILARVNGDIDVTISRFDPMNMAGLNILETTAARIRLEALVPGLDAINFIMGPTAGVKLGDGSGQLLVDMIIDRGVVAPGSSFSYKMSRLDVETPDLKGTVSGEVSLSVDEPGKDKKDKDDAARAVVLVHRAELARPEKGLPPIVVEKLRAIFTTDTLNLLRLPKTAGADLNVVAAAVPDLRWFNFGQKAPVFSGGAAFFRGKIALDKEGRGAGSLRTVISKAAMSWKDTRVTTNAVAEFDIGDVNLAAKTATIRESRIEVKDVGIAYKGEKWSDWWLRANINDAKISEDTIEAAVKLECRDAEPAVGLLDARDVIPGWAAGLLTMEGLKASATVRKSDQGVDFKLLKAEGGSLSIRGRLKKSAGQEAIGAFLVKSGILSVGIKLEKDGPGVHPLASDSWVNEKMAGLDR
jgi:hypothetical protein